MGQDTWDMGSVSPGACFWVCSRAIHVSAMPHVCACDRCNYVCVPSVICGGVYRSCGDV